MGALPTTPRQLRSGGQAQPDGARPGDGSACSAWVLSSQKAAPEKHTLDQAGFPDGDDEKRCDADTSGQHRLQQSHPKYTDPILLHKAQLHPAISQVCCSTHLYLQVLLQPLQVPAQQPVPHGHVSRAGDKYQRPVEAVLSVLMCDRNTRCLEARGIHDSIIPQHIVLTGEDVGGGQPPQLCLCCQQWGRPPVQEPRVLLCQSRAPKHWAGVNVALLHPVGQQGAPVHKLEQVAPLGRDVAVGRHRFPERWIGSEIFTPEPDHERLGQNRHVCILVVRRQVQIQGLKSGINQSLGLQLRCDFRVLQQL